MLCRRSSPVWSGNTAALRQAASGLPEGAAAEEVVAFERTETGILRSDPGDAIPAFISAPVVDEQHLIVTAHGLEDGGQPVGQAGKISALL
jgi:hypothetical protein